MAIILQVYQNKVKPLSIKLALLLLVSFFPSSLIAVTCTGGNILNGIQPNLGLVSALQNTSTSGAAIIDGRTLSIPTNTPCSGSDCFTIDATVTTLELKNFLTSLGYGQDRWRFNSAGPPGMDSGATFKSWQALKGYAEPFLIGYWDVGCGSDVSIISSTRPLNATTMIIVQELFNPNSIKRCAWGAIYEAYPYRDGFTSMVEDYNMAADKVMWTNALLQKIKQYYGATASVIAGGLNVTITPAKSVVEPKLQARSDVKVAQAQSAYSSPVEIYVTNSSSQPVTGANISLSVKTVDPTFAGHDHAGTLNLIKPTGTVSPSSGATLSGLLSAVYTAGEFSAIENITATASYQGCTGTAVSSNITTQLSGLVNLPVASPHVKIGGTAAHEGPDGYNRPVMPDNNHWASSQALPSMTQLFTLYAAKYAAGLYINDISLPKGGRFDEQGNWSGDHQTHRRGIDIDVHITDSGLIYDLVEARLNERNDKAGGKLFFKAVREKSPNHIHIQFHPN